eukprot:3675236-Prymnesium_polylepis.1
MVAVKLHRPAGAKRPALIGTLVDPNSPADLLAQTVGITAQALDEAKFNEVAGRGDEATLLMAVQIVDKLFDPYEDEADLKFPYAIVMKDVTDPSLLANATTNTVAALRQASCRAAAMNVDVKAAADSRTRNGCGVPVSEGRAPAAAATADGTARTFKEFEAELESGEWVDEKPTSQEELE